MDLFSHPCPCCGSNEVRPHTHYSTQTQVKRTIYACDTCDIYYSETFATPITGLTTPRSRIALMLKARSEGMGLKATARTFVLDWECRLAELKPTLLLYALLYEFIHQEIEGDELYTKVNKNKPPHASEGWTIVLRERGRRFLWALPCGRKDQQLFQQALSGLAEVIQQTDSLSLLTDGERRYGHLLFEICHDVIRNGKPGRPQKRRPKGVRVRLKNKGSKKRPGRRRKKYQAPVREHPDVNRIFGFRRHEHLKYSLHRENSRHVGTYY